LNQQKYNEENREEIKKRNREYSRQRRAVFDAAKELGLIDKDLSASGEYQHENENLAWSALKKLGLITQINRKD
jgi:hypothetical protein